MGQLATALERAWRITATGASFAVFGIGGFMLGLVAIVIMRIIIPDRDARAQAARRLISRAFRLFIGFMSVVGVLRWQLQGGEHWRGDRSYLVVANHPTLIDIVFLLAHFDGADCVVKAGVLSNPAWGMLTRAADYVSNENAAELMEECVRRLQAGRTVVMFPEGTRTTPGQPPQFGPLAGAIVSRSGCWCLPVVISCNPLTLYKGLSWHRIPARRVDFRLRLCPPWPAVTVAAGGGQPRRAARAWTRDLEIFYGRAQESPAMDAASASQSAAGSAL